MSTSNRCKENGYTLTELLVVLLVMGFLTSISLPTVERLWPGAMLDAHAKQIEADVNMMRREAMSSAQIYEFVIEPEARSYIVRTQDKVVKRRHWPRRLQIRTHDNRDGDEDKQQTVFYARPDGQLEGGNVLLLSAKGKSQSLTIQAYTKRLQRKTATSK